MRLDCASPARSPRAVLGLVSAWAILAGGWLWLDAETWIVAGLGLFTLPLLWELITGKVARLVLDDTKLTWQSGTSTGHIALTRIDHLRLDRRFDGSLRLSVQLDDGSRQRLPPDCVPPGPKLEEAATRAGLRLERHPFSPF